VQAIVKIPAVAPPEPIEEKIDPSKPAELSFPGDKKTKISIPSGSFPEGASVKFAPRPFDAKKTPVKKGQAPGGPILSFVIEPPGTKASKKVKLELKVSMSALDDYLRCVFLPPCLCSGRKAKEGCSGRKAKEVPSVDYRSLSMLGLRRVERSHSSFLLPSFLFSLPSAIPAPGTSVTQSDMSSVNSHRIKDDLGKVKKRRDGTGSRRRLLEIITVTTAELTQHWFNSISKEWVAIPGGVVDAETGTVAGSVPPDVLNHEGYSGQLSNMLVIKTETIDTSVDASNQMVILIGGGIVNPGDTTKITVDGLASAMIKPDTFSNTTLVYLGEEYYTDSPARLSIPSGAKFLSNIVTFSFDREALKSIQMTIEFLSPSSRRSVLPSLFFFRHTLSSCLSAHFCLTFAPSLRSASARTSKCGTRRTM